MYAYNKQISYVHDSCPMPASLNKINTKILVEWSAIRLGSLFCFSKHVSDFLHILNVVRIAVKVTFIINDKQHFWPHLAEP